MLNWLYKVSWQSSYTKCFCWKLRVSFSCCDKAMLCKEISNSERLNLEFQSFYFVTNSRLMDISELKQRWRRPQWQREGEKSKRFRLAKQQLCACITLFCTFLCRRCTTKTWKCLISRFFDDVNSRRLFTLTSFRSKQLQKKGPWPMSSDLDFTFGQKLLFIFFPSSSSLPFFSFWQRCLNSGWVFWICWACTSSWAVG